MARSWTLEIARDLIQDWSAKRVELAVDRQGLTVELEALESFILEQKPASLEQAERLLDLITIADSPMPTGYERLCSLQGGSDAMTWGGARAVWKSVLPPVPLVPSSGAPRRAS